MSANPVLWGVETTAQQLAQEVVRSLSVTVASVALRDHPGLSLTVKAVGARRPLARPVVGTRVPLSMAPWHRTVFDRREPVFLDQDSPGGGLSPVEAGLSLVPGIRSAFLVPILVGDELMGILGVGEMRSRARAPFTEEKRRRCLALLEEFLATSTHAWEAGRLRRQVRTMSTLIQIVREILDVRSHQDILGCLAAKMADWIGAPVRGILLRARPGHVMEVIGRWHFPEPATEGEAAQLLLALVRAEGHRRGPISVTSVADDPLDPLHAAAKDGETWTRVCLPLLKGDQLLGIACLYVEEELRLANWELEAFRWLAETAAVGMGIITTLESEHAERAWLGRAAWELSTTYHHVALREALKGAGRVISSRLLARLDAIAAAIRSTPAVDGDAGWREIAETVAAEVTSVVDDLTGVARPDAGAAGPPLEVNELVRRTVEIARVKWEDASGRYGAAVRLDFEPGREPLLVDASIPLMGVLVQLIEQAAAALADGGRLRVRAHRDDGHVVVSIADTGPVPAAPDWQEPLSPLFAPRRVPRLGLELSVVRALTARYGGEVRLQAGEAGGTSLVLRVPAAARA